MAYNIKDSATLKEIFQRSAAGEGVAAILESMGIDAMTRLIYLRDNHPQDIRDAKLIQLKERGDLKGKSVIEHEEMTARIIGAQDVWQKEAVAAAKAKD